MGFIFSILRTFRLLELIFLEFDIKWKKSQIVFQL